MEQLIDQVRIRRVRGRPRTRPRRLAGDKAYSAPRIRKALRRRGIGAVIPRREDELKRRRVPFDRQTYRRRSIIEQRIGWIKESRRIATRYEKLALNFLAMVKLTMIQSYLQRLSSDRA